MKTATGEASRRLNNCRKTERRESDSTTLWAKPKTRSTGRKKSSGKVKCLRRSGCGKFPTSVLGDDVVPRTPPIVNRESKPAWWSGKRGVFELASVYIYISCIASASFGSRKIPNVGHLGVWTLLFILMRTKLFSSKESQTKRQATTTSVSWKAYNSCKQNGSDVRPFWLMHAITTVFIKDKRGNLLHFQQLGQSEPNYFNLPKKNKCVCVQYKWKAAAVMFSFNDGSQWWA